MRPPSEVPPSTPAPSAASVPWSGELDEKALIRQAQGGDLSAFDRLVRQHQERVYGTIYHMTANHEDAADLTQDTFIKAYNALRSFKGDCGFFTWLYRIAVNRTLNFLKQRRNRTQHLSLNDLDFSAENDPEIVLLASEQSPRRDLDLTELQQKLNAALLKLSEVFRQNTAAGRDAHVSVVNAIPHLRRTPEVLAPLGALHDYAVRDRAGAGIMMACRQWAQRKKVG